LLAAKTARDERTTESWLQPGRLRLLRPAKGLEKGSLPEEDASGCVNRCIHAIRW
jgi:hypothetical protein